MTVAVASTRSASAAPLRSAQSRTPLRRWPLIALALAALCTSACATNSASTPAAIVEPRAGHLVIVGGGLKDDNQEIYRRFATLARSRGEEHTLIGIIPIASGDGLKAGEEVANRWAKWVNNHVEVIPLTKDDAALAENPYIVQIIDCCSAVWFTGGDQSRITSVLRPDGRSTPALEALHRLLARGGVIGGTSAGAAVMSDPMILGGKSSDAKAEAKSTDPDNTSPSRVRVGPGLGFFPSGLVDQHFLQRNRMGRLIDALHDTQQRHGYGISENRAMVVDLRARTIECIGPNGVCVIDAERKPIEVRVLSTGDTVPLPARAARR